MLSELVLILAKKLIEWIFLIEWFAKLELTDLLQHIGECLLIVFS